MAPLFLLDTSPAFARSHGQVQHENCAAMELRCWIQSPGCHVKMLIRAETSNDEAAVRSINEAAFDSPAEAGLVDALRKQASPLISLVAEIDGTLVGHIMFSPALIPGCPKTSIMGLGPMAVDPAYQRNGIGSKLVTQGLGKCEQLGINAVIVLGHPEFYPRFGFMPASRFAIRSEYDVPDEVFMATELQAGSLDAASGTVRYHEAFGTL